MEPNKCITITPKLSVMLYPDTLQSTYLKLEKEELEVKTLKFNDGSVRVTLPGITPKLEHRYVVIEAFINGMEDLMVIAQIKDVIERHSKSPRDYNLRILSTSYSRYDRVMLDDKSDSFGAKVFADFVNSMKFSSVYLFDNHSEVLTGLINNCRSLEQDVLVNLTLGVNERNINEFRLVAPDKGATKKLKDPDLIFDKVRNVATGQIEGMEIAHRQLYAIDDPKSSIDQYLVIDDICEGGRTFIELAKVFRKDVRLGEKSLSLYVTHGIFANQAIPKILELYDYIYVFNMKRETFQDLTPQCKRRIFVYNLIED